MAIPKKCQIQCAEGIFVYPIGSDGNTFLYWDGEKNTGFTWPTHDPCADNDPNQKSGVPNPGGQVYLRGGYILH